MTSSPFTRPEAPAEAKLVPIGPEHKQELRADQAGQQALCNEAVCGLADPNFKPRRPDSQATATLPAVEVSQAPEKKVVSPAVSDGSLDKLGRRAVENFMEFQPTSTRITMALQEVGDSPKALPKILIRANGRLEYSGDVEKLLATPGADILVELERRQGQLNPTAQQFRAAEELTVKLTNQIREKQTGRAPVTLDDKDNIVKAEVERSLGLRAPDARFRTSDETAEVMRTLHRSKGIDGIDMPRAQTRDFALFETRSVRKQPNETYQDMAQKEAIAALFHPDKVSARLQPDSVIHPTPDQLWSAV